MENKWQPDVVRPRRDRLASVTAGQGLCELVHVEVTTELPKSGNWTLHETGSAAHSCNPDH